MEIDNDYYVSAPKHNSNGKDFATLGYMRDWLEKVDNLLERISETMVIQLDIRGYQLDTDEVVKIARKFAAECPANKGIVSAVDTGASR